MKTVNAATGMLLAVLLIVGCTAAPEQDEQSSTTIDDWLEPRPVPSMPAETLDGLTLPDGCERVGARQEGAVRHAMPLVADLDGDGEDEVLAPLVCSDADRAADRVVVMSLNGELIENRAAGEFVPAQAAMIAKWVPLGDRAAVLLQNVAFTEAGTVSAAFGTLRVQDGELMLDKDTRLLNAQLSSLGFGPILLGMTGRELISSGFGVAAGTDQCPVVEPSPHVEALGLRFRVLGGKTGKVWSMHLVNEDVGNVDGARNGMPLSELEELYGDRLLKGENPEERILDLKDRSMVFTVRDDAVLRMSTHNVPYTEIASVPTTC